MSKHLSYRGKTVDMELLKFQNQHSVALGNAHMNARGDIIGNGGTVIKTREELLQEKERKMDTPDYTPEHQSKSVAPKMDVINDLDESFESFNTDVFTESEESTEKVTKRAPRKTDTK